MSCFHLRSHIRLQVTRTLRGQQIVINRLGVGELHQTASTVTSASAASAPTTRSIAANVSGQFTLRSKRDTNEEMSSSVEESTTGANMYARGRTTSNGQKKKKSINLLRGWPSISLLPAETLRAASQTALTNQSIWAPGLEYGPDPGYQPLREKLAQWLGEFYGEVIATEEAQRKQQISRGEKGEDDLTPEKDSAKADADRITITGGASQSLACLLQSFTDPTRTLAVWIVAPCYFIACPIFSDAGFAGRLRAVPEDDEGADLGVLEREICALEEDADADRERKRGDGNDGSCDGSKVLQYKDPGPHRKIYRHVIYCVPSFSNPSGRTMTLERRRGLVDLARRYDALVICDDVYDMLQWQVVDAGKLPSESSSQQPTSPAPQNLNPNLNPNLNLDKAILPRLADIDIAKGPSSFDPPGKHFGHVVSNGSFSKLVAPGVRTGWTYSTADFAFGTSQTGSTRSGGAPSQLTATIVCELLRTIPTITTTTTTTTTDPNTSSGECQLTKHVNNVLRPAYTRRHSLLLRTITTELVPLGVRVREGSLCGQGDVYGGYFIWMKLPSSTPPSISTASSSSSWPTAKEIADRCRSDEDLMIGNGEMFAVHGDEEAVRFDDAIRLCFAWENEEDLVDGVQRLGRVIRKMLDEGPERWRRRAEKMDTGDMDQAK